MAARKTYDLTAEPTGDLYRSLLDYAVAECTQALLVTSASVLAQAVILDSLSPSLVGSELRHEWPGTRLHSGVGAMVWTYRYGPEVADVLKDAATGLYRWQEPDLPEDLCLLRGPGNVWLGSVAHEADAWLELSESEAATLTAALPGLIELLGAPRTTCTEQASL